MLVICSIIVSVVACSDKLLPLVSGWCFGPAFGITGYRAYAHLGVHAGRIISAFHDAREGMDQMLAMCQLLEAALWMSTMLEGERFLGVLLALLV